ncbi:hypothetical protein B0T25DRAFT_457416 [Lasiosphaeria hispida]|uniref:Uncharacterized protein n=1 Tax=Lasiosphaeria hispida TaxID=260671 RepID=A0AAJ0HET6_9PEZI|nr:hypothetical protein B0T25DRAFT_457416 [Lasiosphaeria hispida]
MIHPVPFSVVKQPWNTYLQWERFSFPDYSGPKDAIAIPVIGRGFLVSAYTVMSGLAVVHTWAILLALGIFWYQKRHADPGTGLSKVNGLSISAWNQRAAPQGSIIDLLFFTRWWQRKKRWFCPLLMTMAAAWAASLAASISIPSTIILGAAAPVNASSIYIPMYPEFDNNKSREKIDYEASTLSRVPARRAAGAAQVLDLDGRVPVFIHDPVQEGYTERNESILRINYSYNITGVDFGLQRFPDLYLNVAGSCITEYDWYNSTTVDTDSKADLYISPIDASHYYATYSDPPIPTAYFDYFLPEYDGYLPRNTSWAAIVSSVNRTSVSPGNDPWYLTADKNVDGKYIVKPARPVLRCWENGAWSFGLSGQTFNISDENSTVLASSGLPKGILNTMRLYLDFPAIFYHGRLLETSALLCGSEASPGDREFDAGRCSLHGDLRQLVFGAYIATVKLFADTTLYPRRSNELDNYAIDKDTNRLADGMDGFVVYTNDVVALYIPALIIIPAVALGTWVLMMLLLYWTPLKLVREMEALQMFREAREWDPDVRLHAKEGRWKLYVHTVLPSSSPPR